MANPLLAAAKSIEISPPSKRGVATFGGANTSRLYQDWWAGNFSPDFETRGVRRLMRARARQLARDNAYARGFLTEVSNNVVGPNGIRLRAEVSTILDELHKASNEAIQDAWADFCQPDNVSADRHDSFVDMERLIVETIAMDGECFIRKRRYFRNAHGFALQIIDADQVDDFYTKLPSPGENEIRSGVEIDEFGGPVAYHVWKRHISDSGRLERIRIPAEEIIHLFVRYRPNQTRGITWFAPVMTSVKMYDGLTEAELVASRAAAAKMGFIVQKNPMLGTSGINPDDDPEVDRLMEAAAGTIDYLGPGEELQTFDPQHPNAMFKDFTKTILRGVARGLGLSYTALTGDLEGVNYSSIRWGMLAERDNWKALQRWYFTQFHNRVYREWLSMALLTGALVLDSRLASDYRQVSWRPRGWAWVDPLKDIQARVLGIQHGMDSRTQAIDEEGGELEDTFENLKNEQELAAKYGIEINPAAPPVPNRPMGTPSKADQEDVNPNLDPNGDPKQGALSEDEARSIWAAAQIAANDAARALGKRLVPVKLIESAKSESKPPVQQTFNITMPEVNVAAPDIRVTPAAPQPVHVTVEAPRAGGKKIGSVIRDAKGNAKIEIMEDET